MIKPNFYDTAKTVSYYFPSGLRHFFVREPSVVISKYPYRVAEGDTWYTLANKVFGSDGVYHWSILSDLNPIKDPDELIPGEIIYLPEIILNDPDNRTINYDSASSTSREISY